MKSLFIICIALFLRHCYGQSEVWQNIGPYGMPETITGSAISGNGNGRMCAIAFVPGSEIYISPLSGNSLHVLDLTNLQTGLLFVQILRNDIPIYTEKIMHL